MKTEELKIAIIDLETYREMLLIGGYIPHKDQWFLFEVSTRKNELDAAVKFLKEEDIDFWTGFNVVKFDAQVLQYVLDEYDSWFDKSWNEVCALIYQFVQDLIDNQNYELPLKYKEHYLDLKYLDLFLILHFDNRARSCSLKFCEFSMDLDIETLPIASGKEGLTENEIQQVVEYWKNDIHATYELYKWCLGDTEHESYKGKNKIQLRLDLIEEMKLSHTAINWNDVKIGAELNKKAYLELTGIDHKKLYEKVRFKKSRAGFTFGECFPKYWKFETKEFNEFFKKIAKTKVNLNVKQDFHLEYNGTGYTSGKGGGHSMESARLLKPTENQILMDCDIASMYPHRIKKGNLYPAHLGPLWNTGYISNIEKRIDAKKKYKETKDKKWDNIQETYKLVLNGNFGRIIDRHDWQYDPFVGMEITVGSQIDIFMLVEDLELAGIKVVSLNTDGILVMMNKDQIDTYKKVCDDWEKQVGNDVQGRLEFTEYSLMAQLSVNDYLAVKSADWKDVDGKFIRVENGEPIEKRTKKKGDFLTDYELHKNKSRSIVPIALEKYFIHGTPIEETIRGSRNIYHFGIAKKASRDYYYRAADKSTGKEEVYDRLIRYYASKGMGQKLYKCKHEHSDKTGPKVSQCESTSATQVVFNKRPDVSNWEALKIDYEWYENQAYKLLSQIIPEIGRDRKEQKAGVLSLF